MKQLLIKIKMCGECPNFSGVLHGGEPPQCKLFEAYSHFVNSVDAPPIWCPLEDVDEHNNGDSGS